MTDPLHAAAEALKDVPGLKMKSAKQRLEIARVVLAAVWPAMGEDYARQLKMMPPAPKRSIADLGGDPDGPLPVYRTRT